MNESHNHVKEVKVEAPVKEVKPVEKVKPVKEVKKEVKKVEE